MGKKEKKAKDSSPLENAPDYIFYSDPLSRSNLPPAHEPSSDASNDATAVEEGRPAQPSKAEVEMSYYGRMAAEEAEAHEKLPAALHSPHVRIQLQKMKRHRPYFMWLVSIIQLGALIASFVLNKQTTGSIIQTQPVLNAMIGPTPGVLITMGARFVPCMRTGTGWEDAAYIVCPDGIKGSNSDGTCTLADICGFNAAPDTKNPNQWYRFITAMGLHGGVLHFMMNMLFQARTGFQMERDFGWWRIAGIYMASGIAGFVFGANFNPLTPSVGCSGALYGLLACLLLDLFQNWRLISRPYWELFKMLIQILASFIIGMFPYVDNFAHIGGFYTGLVAGLLFMPTIHFGRFDKWRKRIMAMVALPVLVVILVMLIRGFYGSSSGAEQCNWCKYLNCIPGMPWCAQKWDPLSTVAP